MWREGWKSVAELSGSDKATQFRIALLLDAEMIRHAIEGSKAYHVFVPIDQAEKAIEILHSDARSGHYAIQVLSSIDSDNTIEYPSAL